MTKTNTGVLALQLKHCNKKKHYTLARMQNGLGNSVSARLSTLKRHQIQAAMNSSITTLVTDTRSIRHLSLIRRSEPNIGIPCCTKKNYRPTDIQKQFSFYYPKFLNAQNCIPKLWTSKRNTVEYLSISINSVFTESYQFWLIHRSISATRLGLQQLRCRQICLIPIMLWKLEHFQHNVCLLIKCSNQRNACS